MFLPHPNIHREKRLVFFVEKFLLIVNFFTDTCNTDKALFLGSGNK